MSSDNESRFAHLLQPIRALADNWNIDIARELEDYLGELEKISFSFDGESNSLNFAEAALVIQGSAVVYSKKVEYLYALLYQTLDYLVEKKQRKASQESAEDNDAAEAEPDFLSLDDALEEGKGIDLVEGDSAPVRTARISNHLIIQSIQADIEPTTDKNENPKNGGRRSDYSMNTFVVDSSGALVQPHDAAKHADLLPPSGSQKAASKDGDVEMDLGPNNTTTNMSLNQSLISNNPTLNSTQASIVTGGGLETGGLDLGGKGATSDDEEDGAEEDDDEEGGEKRASIFGQFSMAQEGAKEGEKVADKGKEVRRSTRIAAGQGEKRTDRPKKRMVDMWAMLDPHEEVGPTKAFKKGKPYKIRQNTKTEPEADAVVPIISIAETPLTFKGVRGPAFQEFAYLYSAELKRRKDAKKRDKLEFSFEETVYAAAAEEEEESHEVPEFSHGAHFNGAPSEVEENESAGLDMGAGVADDDDDDNDGGDVGDANIFAQDESQGDTQTYEDFYAARVEQFIAETAQYAQETNLTKRVNDWKSKLAPVLEEQESHKNFDIIEYGETLIHTLRDQYEGKPGVTINEDGDVDADSDLIVPFSKLTVNSERYEVARKFAAMLQLVNNQNVSVISDKVDSLSFQLLSVKPKFDLENYLAPSLNPTSAPHSPIKIDKTKPKAKDNNDKKAKGKRGRPAKDDVEDPTKKTKAKGKKGQSEPEIDKENVPLNRETRGKRKERVQYNNEEEEEEEEEVLRGPRTKMFVPVAV